jgi:hypothetical protein
MLAQVPHFRHMNMRIAVKDFFDLVVKVANFCPASLWKVVGSTLVPVHARYIACIDNVCISCILTGRQSIKISLSVEVNKLLVFVRKKNCLK